MHLHLQLELEFVVFNTHVETCQETRKTHQENEKKRNVVGKLETDLLETWEVKQKTTRSLSWQEN